MIQQSDDDVVWPDSSRACVGVCKMALMDIYIFLQLVLLHLGRDNLPRDHSYWPMEIGETSAPSSSIIVFYVFEHVIKNAKEDRP